MKSNTGSAGSNSRTFYAQVAPGQNEYNKNASWNDAWCGRVKIRIPALHPNDGTVKDEDLPWAYDLKSTSNGSLNQSSTGICGGEWVKCEYDDEFGQTPIIIGVIGRGSSSPEIVESTNGSTEFKDVSRYNGGLQAGPHQMSGGSSKKSDPRKLPIGSDIKEDAKTEPKFDISKLTKNLSTPVAQYTAKDKAEDKLLLRSIQKGELGPVPQEQIDQLINRINGVGVRGV